MPTRSNINQGVQQCEEEVKVGCSSSLTHTLLRTTNGELVKQIKVIQDVQWQFFHDDPPTRPFTTLQYLTYNEKSALYNSAHTDGILVHEKCLK